MSLSCVFSMKIFNETTFTKKKQTISTKKSAGKNKKHQNHPKPTKPKSQPLNSFQTQRPTAALLKFFAASKGPWPRFRGKSVGRLQDLQVKPIKNCQNKSNKKYTQKKNLLRCNLRFFFSWKSGSSQFISPPFFATLRRKDCPFSARGKKLDMTGYGFPRHVDVQLARLPPKKEGNKLNAKRNHQNLYKRNDHSSGGECGGPKNKAKTYLCPVDRPRNIIL